MKRKTLLIASGIFGLAMSSPAALVAHYTFDETSGSTAFDSSGNGHHATISAAGVATGAAGISGNAYQFIKANSGFVSAGNLYATVTDQLSISVWFNTNTTASSGNVNVIAFAGDNTVVNRYTDVSYYGGAGVDAGRVHTRNRPNNNNDIQSILSGSAVTADAWQHVVMTLDLSDATGPVLSHYLNGDLVEARTLTGAHANNNLADYNIFEIGRLGRNIAGPSQGPVDYFGGFIDDVRVYSHALSGSEVNDLYTAFIPEPSTLALAGLGFLSLIRRRR